MIKSTSNGNAGRTKAMLLDKKEAAVLTPEESSRMMTEEANDTSTDVLSSDESDNNHDINANATIPKDDLLDFLDSEMCVPMFQNISLFLSRLAELDDQEIIDHACIDVEQVQHSAAFEVELLIEQDIQHYQEEHEVTNSTFLRSSDDSVDGTLLPLDLTCEVALEMLLMEQTQLRNLVSTEDSCKAQMKDELNKLHEVRRGLEEEHRDLILSAMTDLFDHYIPQIWGGVGIVAAGVGLVVEGAPIILSVGLGMTFGFLYMLSYYELLRFWCWLWDGDAPDCQ